MALTIDDIEVGKRYRLIEPNAGCDAVRGHEQHESLRLQILGARSGGISYAGYCSCEGSEERVASCAGCIKPRYLEPIDAINTMDKTLNLLTDEQKELLSSDDQALRELGVITDRLQLIDANYVVNFLFKQNKKAIAKQAAAEVEKLKEQAEKKGRNY